MFKKKDEGRTVEEEAARDEHAYEDSWYRSLKALREQEPEEEGAAEDVGAPAADEAEAPSEIGDGAPEDAGEDEDWAQAPPENGEATGFDPSDVEARAGQLLERLRAIQRAGDQ